MSETLIRQVHEEWMEITLNRPARLNSFNDEMHAAFRPEGGRLGFDLESFARQWLDG